ncbi:MAG: hypothetical protein ACE5F6_07350, partial [Anaerolineae bacterium]
MPHEHHLKKRHLLAFVACLLFLGLAVFGNRAAAQPGSTDPARDSQTWSEPATISDPGGSVDSVHPDIAVCANGTVHVVWEQGGELWYRSGNPATGWDEAHRVEFKETGVPARGSEPAIAASADCTLHLVWKNFWFNNDEIFYSSNDGTGFLTPARVSWSGDTQSAQPAIAVDPSGEPRIVWVEAASGYRLYEGKQIPELPGYWNTGPISRDEGQVPSLAVDDQGRLHLAWMTVDSPSDIAYKWQEQVDQWPQWWFNISGSPDHSRRPDITISNDKAVVVWQEAVDGDDEIYVTWRELDSYASFVGTHNLSNSDASSRAPAVAVDGSGRFYVAWDEGSPTNAILTRPWLGSGNWWDSQTIS